MSLKPQPIRRTKPLKRSAIKKRGPKLIDQCFALLSKIVRLRDRTCRRCGTDQFLQNAHIISRAYHTIALREDNCMALCRACHKWQTHRPLEGDEFFRSVIGEEKFEDLRREALTHQGYGDLKVWLVYLRQRLKAMEA